MRRVGFVVAWVAATAVVTAVAWNVVAAAGSRVSDEPLTQVIAVPPDAGDPAATTTTTEATPTTTTSVPETTTTTPAPGATIPPPTTTAPSWTSTTASGAGGSVAYSWREGEVRLDAVSPAPGWAFEVHRDTPTDIEVRFAPDDARIRIRWTSSGLEVEIRDP